MGTIQIDGSTPKLTIGNATAEDATILFDGNAQDFYIALDDSADDLLIGLGSTVGTTPAISIDENLAVKTYGDITMTGTTPVLTIGDAGEEDTAIVFDGNAQDFHIGLDDSSDSLTIGLGSTLGTTSHIVIDEAGHVTMPLQCAFSAYKSGATTHDSGDVTVPYSVEQFDLNANYNSGTYVFTAPVTGKYFLSANMQHQNISDEYMSFNFKSSNREWPIMHEIGAVTGEIGTATNHVLIDMDASDTVHVEANSQSDTSWTARAGGSFSGWLVA